MPLFLRLRFLTATLLLTTPITPAIAYDFAQGRARAPNGWTRLDWPEKRKILFGLYAPTDKEKELINAAVPADAVPPADPPRVLVYYRCQYPHASIATGVFAMEQLGKLTRAFRTTVTDDPAKFNPITLREHDAVLLISTTDYDRTIGTDGQVALTDYIEQGGGLAGIHAASDASKGWSTGAKVMGGIFQGHPWLSHGTWAIKVESPNHPLNAAFKNKGFWFRDEIYIYRPGTFSRGRSRVLLSLDMSQQHNVNSKQIPQRMRDSIDPHGDYPIAWLQEWKQGRVFYSNLGHNPETFYEPAVLRHFLDGVLYATGRLKADATPSAELEKTEYATAPARDE